MKGIHNGIWDEYKKEMDETILSRGESSHNVSITFCAGASREDIHKILMKYQGDTARRLSPNQCMCCGGNHPQWMQCPHLEAKS